jgi:hypothetical protein
MRAKERGKEANLNSMQIFLGIEKDGFVETGSNNQEVSGRINE